MVRRLLVLLATTTLANPVCAQPPYQIGETVELQANGAHWQRCSVVDPGSDERVMRLRCEPYDAGGYRRDGGIYTETWRSAAVRR